MDTNEMHNVLKALEASERLFKAITDSAIDAVVLSDGHGAIVYWNKSAEQMFGYHPDEVMGESILHLLPVKHRSLYQEALERFINTGVPTFIGKTTEMEGLNKAGEEFPIELSLSTYELNEETYLCGIIRDISVRKRNEEELKKSESFYRAVFDQAYVGIAKISLTGKFLAVNDRFCEILGYDMDQILHMGFQDITHVDDMPRSEDFRTKLISGELNKVVFQKKYIHKNQNSIDTNITATVVRDNDDTPLYFIAVFDDVTQEKKDREVIEASLKEKDLLLKEVHHRVKNNLQLIKSFMNLYSQKVHDEKVSQVVGDANKLIHSIALVHMNLYQHHNFSRVDFREYIGQLCDFYSQFIPSDKSINIIKELHDVSLPIDKSITSGLIVNEVISNAVKHAFKGKSNGEIHVSLDCKDNETSIRISDDGVGLPKNFSLENNKSFGLDLVRILLDQLDASYEMNGEKGMCFSMKFPVSDKA